MWRFKIVTVGRIREKPYTTIQDEYVKRISPAPVIEEIPVKNNKPDSRSQYYEDKLCSCLDLTKPVVACDEKGKNLSSREFTAKIGDIANIHGTPVQFVIGGPDGLPPLIKEKAILKISFGLMTWPHLLVRIMLLEQLYRAQTIYSNHPYHKD